MISRLGLYNYVDMLFLCYIRRVDVGIFPGLVLVAHCFFLVLQRGYHKLTELTLLLGLTNVLLAILFVIAHYTEAIMYWIAIY